MGIQSWQHSIFHHLIGSVPSSSYEKQRLKEIYMCQYLDAVLRGREFELRRKSPIEKEL